MPASYLQNNVKILSGNNQMT